jgi:hypothetical protein
MDNGYLPRSGTEKRHEREHFYSTELAYLLTTAPQLVVMGGDFNCVLERKDVAGNFNYSWALEGLVRGMALQDAWQGGSDRPRYTHYSVGGGSLDRIYNPSPTITQRRGSRANKQLYTTYCKCEGRGTSELLLHCGTRKVIPRRHLGALHGPSPHN